MSKMDSSWKNVKDWAKGKDQLKNAILQHPEESTSPDNSIYNYIKSKHKNNINSDSKILNFAQYRNLGRS